MKGWEKVMVGWELDWAVEGKGGSKWDQAYGKPCFQQGPRESCLEYAMRGRQRCDKEKKKHKM